MTEKEGKDDRREMMRWGEAAYASPPGIKNRSG